MKSVFWKVAALLVAVQVATVGLAVLLTALFAYDRSLTLVANSLRLRLDGLAEEVEQRADGTLADGLAGLPLPLRLDLAARFPDPVTLLDLDGTPLQTIPPNPDAFSVPITRDTTQSLPDDLGERLTEGDIFVQLDAGDPGGTWGLVPVYDLDGLLAGGLLVQPLRASIAMELAGTRAAYVRALTFVSALAVLVAMLLSGLLTWGLVRPLRRITDQVERIGAGDYTARLAEASGDEIGRLGGAVNQMAEAVEASVEALRSTDRLRRELIANVGHDLRTPLAALRGYLEEAERHLERGDDAAAEQAVEAAHRQGSYLSRLVADLFELSVLDSAPAPLRREPIPLAELVEDAASTHRPLFEKTGITFRVERAPSLPILEGDGVRLMRVLHNLLTNARQHTPPGGTVRLTAQAHADAVEIAVHDTGRGIAPEALAHVFERHYRGADARTRTTDEVPGTGLGLPISRAIARAHGGDLTATSAPGVGSVFTLRLPLAGG